MLTAVRSGVDRLALHPWGRLVLRPLVGIWGLARQHNLNPWVFIGMSVLGYAIHALVYLPWFRTQEWQLTFLVLLRVVALVVPTYIFLKGRRLARAFNMSVALMFSVNTAWHVCYYVYLL